jgi:hypothetical protein
LPQLVVIFYKYCHCCPDFFDGSEYAAIDGLFFESSIKSFNNTVGFGFSDECKAGSNAPEFYLEVWDALNLANYGKAVKPADILVKISVSNWGADELRAA